MVKKYSKIVLLCLSSLVQAEKSSPRLELKPSYFFYANSTMRHIYKHGGFEIQGSGSYPIWEWINGYTSLGFVQTHGKSLGLQEPTTLWRILFDVGAKAIGQCTEKTDCFLAIGPRYFYLHQHNTSQYVPQSVHLDNVGLFLNFGFNHLVSEHCELGLFGEYSYEKAIYIPNLPNVYSNGNGTVQVGGVAYGASLGYAF